MTKHDIRIRRQSFSKGQIARHKDFKKFSGMYEKKRSKHSLSRMLLVIITLIILIVVVYFGYFKVKEAPQDVEKKEEPAPSIWDEFEDTQ